MRSKLNLTVAGLIVGMTLHVSATQGCGSSSGSNASALCDKTCAKQMSCGMTNDVEMCKTTCKQQAAAVKCSNESAIEAAVQACLNMSNCDSVAACLIGDTIPDCQGPGAAGTGGTADSGTQ